MPDKSGDVNNQPVSLEKRLPIALGLMMAVLLISQWLFKPAPGPKPVAPSDQNQKAAAALAKKPAETAAAPAQAAAQTENSSTHIQAPAELSTVIDTKQYHIVFTNRGATIRSWVLKGYRDNTGKPLELINPAVASIELAFAIEVKDRKLSIDPNSVLYQAKVSSDSSAVDYEFSDGKTDIRKSFRFGQDSFLANVRSVVLENNTPVQHFLVWRGGFGDIKIRNAAVSEQTVRYDANAGKLIKKSAKDAKDGPITDSGNYTFGGLEDNFFAAVALPVDSSALEIRTYNDALKGANEDKTTPYVGVGISTGTENELSLYVGPKDIDILRKVNPKLAQLVDWGFFGILAKPLFLSLNWVHDRWTNNYGWAIILVTLIINVLLFPFKLTSLKSARKMQKLQPQIQAINAKYKDISIRDPRKAEQNQEVMALYKREGVNPLGGCLPMLLQLPFFYAFYRVLNIAIELRHAPWLWVWDLSSAESLPIHILPIILIATQFFSQKLTPAAGVDPNQQRMMMFMPLMMGFFFYYASAGLVVYWLTSNLVGIAQQLIINKFMPPPAPLPPPPKAPVRKTVKK